MENTTYQIRFLILDNEDNVLKNFILTEREYETREDAAEAAQTVCCVLMNHCGWNVFYRIIKPIVVGEGDFHEMAVGGSVASNDEPSKENEDEDEEENCSFDEIEDEDIDKFLAWMRAYCQGEKDE